MTLTERENAVFRATPREFTAERDALVAELKAAGRADDAKAVKAWRRPIVPVWLWNRLVLDGEKSAREAVKVAAGLAEAIAARGAELTEAIAALRAASAAVVSRARELAAEAEVGFSPAQERELAELVQALPWSESVRHEAARGRLHEMPPPVDPLDAMRALATGKLRPPAPPAPAKSDAVRAQLSAEAQATRQALAEAEAALAGAQKVVERAQSGLAQAQRSFEDAQRAVDEARERRDAAEAALKEL